MFKRISIAIGGKSFINYHYHYHVNIFFVHFPKMLESIKYFIFLFLICGKAFTNSNSLPQHVGIYLIMGDVGNAVIYTKGKIVLAFYSV